jgi:hypothetical protein
MSRQDQATARAGVICRVDPEPERTGNTKWVRRRADRIRAQGGATFCKSSLRPRAPNHA